MHVETKTMHRISDKLQSEFGHWVRDPPKLGSLLHCKNRCQYLLINVVIDRITLEIRSVRVTEQIQTALLGAGWESYCGLYVSPYDC
jgi:hypothetical protein